jgi:Tol biopolymer transport system component
MRVPIRALLVLAAVAAAVVSGVAATPASADFTPMVLVSGSTTEQSDYASQPVISANGAYVIFTGSQAGVPGIYRKNLQTGALDLVAPGDAGAPSVSADGRYVSFTTADADPVSGTGRACSSVYVRDMTVPVTQASAFTLASAVNGGTASLVYGGSGTKGCPGGGSAAADRVALSSDGQRVAFTVVGASDLTTGAPGPVTTPPAQVAVRDLATDTTTLVSQTQASLGAVPEPVPGGATMTDNSTGTGGQTGTLNSAPGDSAVAISADGTTVAWLGIDIPSQAPAAAADEPNGHDSEYDEPLWRRIADGPSAPTLRVLGGDAAGEPCPQACDSPLDTQWSGEENPTPGLDQGPERGSLIAYDGFTSAGITSRSTLDDGTPQLSADGRTVAILSTQPATGHDPSCTQTCSSNVSANAYVVNMAPGLSRAQAVTRLTEWASEDFTNDALAGPLESIAISPEGTRVAFVTRRVVFPYSPPALITPQLSGAANEQLYLGDLADGTLQLVSEGYDGQPANGVVESPSFSAGDGPIVFASSATNLVYGALSDVDGGSEVFTTAEVKPPAVPGVETITPPPANPAITPEWVIGTSVIEGRDGSVRLSVSVPGAGALRVAARAAVPVSGPARTARSARSARTARGRKARRRRAPVPRVSVRTVASARARPTRARVVRLRLTLPGRYRTLLSRTHGLYATVAVTFTGSGRPKLSERLPVDFYQVKRKASRR